MARNFDDNQVTANGYNTINNDRSVYIPRDYRNNPILNSTHMIFQESLATSGAPGFSLIVNALNYLARNDDIGVPKDTDGNKVAFTTPAQIGTYLFGIVDGEYTDCKFSYFKFTFTNMLVKLESGGTEYPVYLNVEIDGANYKQWGNLNTNGQLKIGVIKQYKYQSLANGNGTNVDFSIEFILDTSGNGTITLAASSQTAN